MKKVFLFFISMLLGVFAYAGPDISQKRSVLALNFGSTKSDSLNGEGKIYGIGIKSDLYKGLFTVSGSVNVLFVDAKEPYDHAWEVDTNIHVGKWFQSGMDIVKGFYAGGIASLRGMTYYTSGSETSGDYINAYGYGGGAEVGVCTDNVEFMLAYKKYRDTSDVKDDDGQEIRFSVGYIF